jgi:predicted nucleic acid-binding protein
VVLDASTALSWMFDDERDAEARAGADAVLEHGAIAPGIWRWEIQNALLAAERRMRISIDEVSSRLAELAAFPIEIDPAGPRLEFGQELDIARRFGLSVYDAAYVELALRRGFRLMTRDAKLIAAADSLKIRWKR